MSAKLFIIDYDFNDFKNENAISICNGIYTDLETAKNKLKSIFKNTSDYKFFYYKIKIFELIGREYKFTNHFYTYIFDKFIEYQYED